MCKHGVEKLPFVIRYVPDCYKNQQISDKAVDNYLYTLKFVPDCYKSQKNVW